MAAQIGELKRQVISVRNLTFIKASGDESKIWVILAVALTMLSLLPVWLVEFLPLQDYPYNLLRVHIIANYANPAFNYNDIFTISLLPIPYILADYLILVLTWLVPIQIAGKLVVTLYVVLIPWSTFYLVRSVDERKTILGFFSYLFIYNWYFNKGFITFALSIPFFLLAVGYWWRHKHELTWPRQLLFSALILGVYLSHLFTFVYLVYTFLVLVILTFRADMRRILQTSIPFVPSLILFGIAFTYHFPRHVENSGALVLLYPSLGRKILIVKNYFVSFSPDREQIILLIAAIVAVVLLLANIRTLKRNVFFALLAMLVLLYLIQPTYITPIYNNFAARVLIFIVFVGLLSLAVSESALLRGSVLLILVIISAFHLVGVLRDYQQVNQGLGNYYAAIEQIPAGEKVRFETDGEITQVGRISPFAFFRAYYYMEKGSPSLPRLRAFIGTLRSVQYKKPVNYQTSDAARLSPLLAQTREVNPGGYALVLSPGDNNEVDSLAHRYGYRPILTVGGVELYRRQRVSPEAKSVTATVSFDSNLEYDTKYEYSYLLLYEDVAHMESAIEPGFERVFAQGYAHVFRRLETLSDTIE